MAEPILNQTEDFPARFFAFFPDLQPQNQYGGEIERNSNASPDSLQTTPSLLITVALLCFGLSPTAKPAPPPAPDGGYPSGNTAEGVNALHDVSTTVGINNFTMGANALTHEILPANIT